MKEDLIEKTENIGDNHILTSVETPMVKGAFDKSDDQKIEAIQGHFKSIMEELGLDLSDDSLSGTPYRVAKMYVKEMFQGLNPENKPKLTTFDNKYGYQKMLIEQNITLDSACEHHFLPIVGYAHIAYIAEDRVIGLSKLNRLVNYYARRPQQQERLCMQILKDLQDALQTESVMVVVNSRHLCVSSRGIQDKASFTTTIEYGGKFNDQSTREEFFKCLDSKML